MATTTWDIRTATKEFLVEVCQQAEKDKGPIGGHAGGDRVVKVSDDIAVKYGIVRIPKVYRFFQHNHPVRQTPMGYLFMEYVSGQALDELDLHINNDIIPRVAKIITHLSQIRGGQVPGPVSGGQAAGYLWGDNGARTTFTSVSDLEAWLNKRLALREKSIDLGSYPLVLCHLDLCRRNMILEKNGTICLVDWGFAGIYPRFCEVASLSCMNPYDEPYEKPLIQAITTLLGLTEEEKQAMALLQIARAASLRYTFESDGNTYALPEGFASLPPLPPLFGQ